MTTLTPDERAREALAIRIFNAPAGPNGRTVGGVLDIGAYGHAMDMCRQIAEIVHREECSIITAETPSPDEREGMAEALKFTAAYRDVEIAARALVERIAGQLHVGLLNWDREFLALKAALAATEGGDAPESSVRPAPETSPAPLAPGEEELARCPFCKSSYVKSADAGYNGLGYVECQSCGACGPEVTDVKEAISKWNECALLLSKIEQAREVEREACAKLCDAEILVCQSRPTLIQHGKALMAIHLAAAIRQRGVAK